MKQVLTTEYTEKSQRTQWNSLFTLCKTQSLWFKNIILSIFKIKLCVEKTLFVHLQARLY